MNANAKDSKEAVAHCAPVGKDDYVSIQHTERYRFAMSRLEPGMKVLDVASGNGYGTAMLMQHGCDIVGVEYDLKTLEVARQLWGHDGFVHADALALPFENETFDAVVSFETIEHVHEGDRFLAEMRRVLKPQGLFISSTPNIAYTSHPEYHVNEYQPETFFHLVESNFASVERFGQYFKATDRMGDLYLWRVRNRLIAILNRIGVAGIIKSLLGRNSEHISATAPQEPQQWINELLSAPPSTIYNVRKVDSNMLLRIMLVVARKDQS